MKYLLILITAFAFISCNVNDSTQLSQVTYYVNEVDESGNITNNPTPKTITFRNEGAKEKTVEVNESIFIHDMEYFSGEAYIQVKGNSGLKVKIQIYVNNKPAQSWQGKVIGNSTITYHVK